MDPDPSREAAEMVDALCRTALPKLTDILPPYDPDINHTPPRPPNTYVLFRVWMSKLGDRQTVISHLIWREVKIRKITRETIVPHFERLAREAKEVHLRVYPEYRYQPGKRGAELDIPRQRGPKKKKRNQEKAHQSASRSSVSESPSSASQQSRDAPTPIPPPQGRGDFELHQSEALAARIQAYREIVPSPASSSSRDGDGARAFPSRYLPQPHPTPRGSYSAPSPAGGSVASSSRSHATHSHSNSYSSHSSSLTTLSSPASSSSSSSSPRRSPTREGSSSSDSDSDFEFNFVYDPHKNDTRHHNYRTMESATRMDGNNVYRSDVHHHPSSHNWQRNSNIRSPPSDYPLRTAQTVSTTLRPVSGPQRPQRDEYSDYDSGPEKMSGP